MYKNVSQYFKNDNQEKEEKIRYSRCFNPFSHHHGIFKSTNHHGIFCSLPILPQKGIYDRTQLFSIYIYKSLSQIPHVAFLFGSHYCLRRSTHMA